MIARRGFLAACGALVLPWEPERVYSFGKPDAVPTFEWPHYKIEGHHNPHFVMHGTNNGNGSWFTRITNLGTNDLHVGDVVLKPGDPPFTFTNVHFRARSA